MDQHLRGSSDIAGRFENISAAGSRRGAFLSPFSVLGTSRARKELSNYGQFVSNENETLMARHAPAADFDGGPGWAKGGIIRHRSNERSDAISYFFQAFVVCANSSRLSV
jgi:hypothetical protein